MASELQAQNRVHRIGQTKPVRVRKLIVNDTVEINLLKLQTKKNELATDILTTDDDSMDQRSNKLTMDDLIGFFE